MTTRMSVSVFEHPLPERCPEGHRLSRGQYRIGWATCSCPPAMALLGRGLPAGHHWMVCRICDDAGGTWRHWDPACEEAGGG